MATLATEKGKEFALQEFEKRQANQPKKVDNSLLPVGSPMCFYCNTCGHLSDKLPESYVGTPKKHCDECQALKDTGWLQ